MKLNAYSAYTFIKIEVLEVLVMNRVMDNFLHDMLRLERQRNALQDNRIDALEYRFELTIQWFQTQIQAFQERLQQLETENAYLKMLNHHQEDIIFELQCHADPYSLDGNAICNSGDDD